MFYCIQKVKKPKRSVQIWHTFSRIMDKLLFSFEMVDLLSYGRTLKGRPTSPSHSCRQNLSLSGRSHAGGIPKLLDNWADTEHRARRLIWNRSRWLLSESWMEPPGAPPWRKFAVGVGGTLWLQRKVGAGAS